jgi:UDP-glucose 4-epimerase
VNTLVTGGTGFIGSYVVRRLVEAGDRVIVFDRYPSLERIDSVSDEVTLVRGDILELQELIETIDRHQIDRIAHLAFLPGAVEPGKMLPYLRTQCMGTVTVFDAARLRGVRRLVTASSVAIYGDPTGEQAREEDATRPTKPYGACKQWCEHIAHAYNATCDMQIVSFRLCASLGVGRLGRASLAAGLTSDAAHFMAFPELAALGHAVTMPPDHQVTDVLYAADAAQAWWLALTADRPTYEVYNLRAEQRRVADLTAAMRRLLPDAEISVSDEPIRRLQLMDNTRLIEDLGFEPEYSLEHGVEQYISEVRQYATARG